MTIRYYDWLNGSVEFPITGQVDISVDTHADPREGFDITTGLVWVHSGDGRVELTDAHHFEVRETSVSITCVECGRTANAVESSGDCQCC